MLWLIEANIATTGKPHLRNRTRLCVLNFRALDTLLREPSHLSFQVVANEVEFVGIPSSVGGRAKISQR
jgi:hypothetical protein